MRALDAEELAGFVAERVKEDPRMQELIKDVDKLDHLREDAGWQTLYKRILEQKTSYMLRIARQLMAGVPEADLHDKITYMRGYYAGAMDTIEQPQRAFLDLEQAARRAYLAASLQVSEAVDESPYI